MNRKLLNNTVYITGAGPGDPDLLTLKAKEIIEKSDVIAYDNLVSKEILELAHFINPNAKLVYVGKIGGEHEKSLKQGQINNLLLELAKDYKVICRLKGGDPNIFGRGGEEAGFLKENNISFEIIPGVSSISSVPAYAGIPLTHRDCNSSFTVLTAHEDPSDPSSSIKWDNFDAVNSTLVLLMGVKHLPGIIDKLTSLGRGKNTPVAIIYWGTTSYQKTITGTLETITKDTEKHQIKAPSIIVIGKVVNYREILNWFEDKPLFGKKVLITRAKDQSFSFASKLIKHGAKPIVCPIVNYKINTKEIYNKDIINNLSRFNWIFFTSQNSVRFFFEILQKNSYDSRALSNCQIATVGFKTKLELEKYNIKADFIPKKFSFQDLVSELSEKYDLQDAAILHPTQTEMDRPSPLQIKHWEIYSANFITKLDESMVKELTEVDIITFFSSNTAKHFKKLIDINAVIATIGTETAQTVKELFGKVDVTAKASTEDGLIESLEEYFEADSTQRSTKHKAQASK